MKTHLLKNSLNKSATSLLLCLVLCTPFIASAEAPRSLQVSPAVIDEKVKQRDIIKQSITIQNVSGRPLNLFPAVEDVNPQNGDQNFSYAADSIARSDSLANWIELSRGVIALSPGETKTVPFVIKINMNAVPGTYHAAITFTDGETRDGTLTKAPNGVVTLNVEVQADIKEDLQIKKFTTERIVFSGDDVFFNYVLQNIGNQELKPAGDIRIYDRRGREVATVDVNRYGKLVGPDQTSQLASVWSAVNGFGQYKALITVNYGKSQVASVQDTMYFWIIPWKQVLGLLTITGITIVILALYFHKWFEERHLHKLAMAGLLNTHPVTASAIATATSYIPRFQTPPVIPVKKNETMSATPKKEPSERIVVKLAENIVIAWRLFVTFKRSGRLTPEDIAKKKIVQTESSVPKSEVPVIQQVKSSHASHAQTVDLKSILPKSRDTVHEGHIVNLKKRA
jgi:hypothetical protein